VPKFRRKVPRHDANRIFVSRSKNLKGERSRSPGPLMGLVTLTFHLYRVPHLPNDEAYELQTWYMDIGRRPASATGAMTSKVKVARSRDQSEPS